jgi:hypothetical protein
MPSMALSCLGNLISLLLPLGCVSRRTGVSGLARRFLELVTHSLAALEGCLPHADPEDQSMSWDLLGSSAPDSRWSNASSSMSASACCRSSTCMQIAGSEERWLQAINDSFAGNMDVNQVVKLFDCKNHPDHLNGMKSKATLIGEFMDTVTGDELTWPAFQRYYRSVAACVTESQFHQMVHTVCSPHATCQPHAQLASSRTAISHWPELFSEDEIQQTIDWYPEMCSPDANLQAQASASL